ncbi:MAG: zinc-binding dehydrogenase [Anaerolineales bacterium]
MKAVVYYERASGAVEIRDVPVPTWGPDECLVKVKYCGICGTELHLYHGQLDLLANPPVILGHEWCGEVVEVGERVKGFRPGDRVVSETAAYTCGTCSYCRAGEYHLCPERLGFGYGVDGAFTSYVHARAVLLHPIPDEVSYEAAAMCEPICVAYNALFEKSRIRPGDTVVVIGPGPIGLFATQLAKLAGAGTVIVTGTGKDRARLDLARQLGADYTVVVPDEDPVALIKRIGDGMGAHLVVDSAGTGPAVKQAIDLVRRNGQITKIGFALKPLNLTLDELVTRGVTLQGSFSHNWRTWEAVLQLLRLGRIQTEPLLSAVLPITAWREAFEQLESQQAVKILLHPVD